MQKENRFGLVKLLLVIAALVAANFYVSARTTSLQAQGDPCPPGGVCQGNRKCTSPVPLPLNYCEYYPTFTCSIATCEETALEP